MSSQNPVGSPESVNVGLSVFTIILTIMSLLVPFMTDRIAPGKQIFIFTIVGLLMIGIGIFLIKRHKTDKWMGVFVLAVAAVPILSAAFTAYGAYMGTSAPVEGEGLSQCFDFYNNQRYQEAIDCFNKAKTLNEDFKAKEYLALSYIGLKRFEKAVAILEDLYTVNPDEVRPHISGAYYELALAASSTQEAIRYQTILRKYDQGLADKLKTVIGSK